MTRSDQPNNSHQEGLRTQRGPPKRTSKRRKTSRTNHLVSKAKAPTLPSNHMQPLERLSWPKTVPAPKSNRLPPQLPARPPPLPSRNKTVAPSTHPPPLSNNTKTKIPRTSTKPTSSRRRTSSKWPNRLHPTPRNKPPPSPPDPTRSTQPPPKMTLNNSNRQKEQSTVTPL